MNTSRNDLVQNEGLRGEDNLAWTALRYVLGELSDEEATRFDERLAVDQQAREEVARAVELSQAIAIASAPETPAVRPEVVRPEPVRTESWLQRVRWMSVGVAACLAVLFTLDGIQFRGNSGRVANGRRGIRAPQFDVARLSGILNHSWTGDDEATSDQVDTAETTAPAVAVEDEADMAVPRWLLAAVTEKRDAAGQPAEVDATGSPIQLEN